MVPMFRLARAAALGRHIVLLPAVAIALVLPIVTDAGPYKWVDEQGVAQFADRPPTDVPLENVDGPRFGTVGEALERRRAAERSAWEAKRAAILEAAQQAAEPDPPATDETSAPSPDRPIIESNYSCEQARDFQTLFAAGAQRPGKFFTRNADGSFKPSSEGELAALAEEWGRAAATLCQDGIDLRPLKAPQPAVNTGEEPEVEPEIAITIDESPLDASEPADEDAAGGIPPNGLDQTTEESSEQSS